ncbi:hypothetical protein AUG19_04435 [archaeon 13_1_20CM_2_54_9]|nr:MAG: hypothetical protein AUJ07_09115 [Crenarchaeota archaeon 13_1_40CM_3_53_5]OLE75782.1 MAG: hypothetical protein AUG19_04435 [archaeon 13_1_20CM_2_54_9]
MATDHSTIPGLSKARLEALTDGIFATVMTILVLTLSVPVITGPLTSAQLASEVLVDIEALAPNILGYVMSFLLLITVWISHHNVFHYISSVDRPLLWLNAAFLLTVGFIPFSTALLGRYPLVQLPVVICGANIFGISLFMQAILAYTAGNKAFVADGWNARIMGRISLLWRIGMIKYATAILLSFISPAISVGVYVAALFFFPLSSIFGFRSKQERRHPDSVK